MSLQKMRYLDLLRGFVTVCRTQNISKAADELCLTQSAVSKQIIALERQLGFSLFVRGHRSVTLTDDGVKLFRVVDEALEQILSAVNQLQEEGRSRPVTLTATVGIAGLWLLPRLARLHATHPDLDVKVAADNRLMQDLCREQVDLAIRYCSDHAAPEGAVKLFSETVVPVAHPALGISQLSEPKQLSDYSLLEYDDPKTPWLQWSSWLEHRGWPKANSLRILRFNQYDQVIQAALAGQGLALGRVGLINDLIQNSQLLRVSDVCLTKRNHAYWLLMATPEPREEVQAVAQWIRTEAQRIGLLDT